MNILMMTNTYLPHVGGVANSVAAFTKGLRELGHRVIVMSPHFKGENIYEEDVIRVPAIQHFNGSDFSVKLPIPGSLENRLKDFKPDIVHSHHPFFVGSTAVRVSNIYKVPLVFTHHTMFEQYTHYIGGIPRIKEFVINLSTGYANMSDAAIAPSESFAAIMKERGVKVPIEIIPTGIDTEKFKNGDCKAAREFQNIPQDAFVAGFVGRLESEKNLEFLSKAVALFLHQNKNAHFLVVGYGSLEEQLKEIFYIEGLSNRARFAGKLTGQSLIDVYHSMDVFVFSSKTETQGMVLAEAMAAGVPAIALDACGSREVIENGVNGYLVMDENVQHFADVLTKMNQQKVQESEKFQSAAFQTAKKFSISLSVSRLISIYEKLQTSKTTVIQRDDSMWQKAIEEIKTEYQLFSNFTVAVGDALHKGKDI